MYRLVRGALFLRFKAAAVTLDGIAREAKEPQKSRQCCCGLIPSLGQEFIQSDFVHLKAGDGNSSERNRIVCSFCVVNDSLNRVMY